MADLRNEGNSTELANVYTLEIQLTSRRTHRANLLVLPFIVAHFMKKIRRFPHAVVIVKWLSAGKHEEKRRHIGCTGATSNNDL